MLEPITREFMLEKFKEAFKTCKDEKSKEALKKLIDLEEKKKT